MKKFKKIFKLKPLINNNEGALAYFVVFCLLAFMLLTIFAVFSPMMVNINTQFLLAGEDIINQTQDAIAGIQDNSIRNEINESLGYAKQSTADQIVILNNFFQYAWILIIIVVSFVIYILARSNVEVGIR